jgi:hypothetical protein
MNSPKRNPSPSGSARRRDPQPENVDENLEEWFDPEEFESADRPAASEPARVDDEDKDEDDIGIPVEVAEADDDAESNAPGKRSKKRNAKSADGKSFFETLGDGLREAGETAQRYTNIGVTRAGLEKLRFELRSAHAQLGEMVMRCWADAPDVGLTSKDPAVFEAVKQVKLLRRTIREKQAKIAELRKKTHAS